jgi:hypothetical protein
MPRVVSAQHGNGDEAARLAEAVARANPDYRLRAGTWDGEGTLAAPAGTRYLWLVDGRGEVFLPAGYRTQEGDGEPLPASYGAEALSDHARAHLRTLREALARGAIHPRAQAPVMALCAREVDGAYRGDVRGDLWLLLESGLDPQEWVASREARLALRWFLLHFEEVGWSVKREAGWERLLPGDQLIATPSTALRVRGRFRYWEIEDAGATQVACSAVRRLRYLKDTAGGCSPGFDAFRRLNLTWHPTPATRQRVALALGAEDARSPSEGCDGAPGGSGQPDQPDAPNRLNSHVLHIEGAQSRTHYHPETPVGGGHPQHEFYFVLDPVAYRLRAPAGARPRLYAFPDVENWRDYEVIDLVPGLAVFIPPGTGHRGVDAFVNVVTVPGFKPGNELYVDSLIKAHGAGAPFNAAFA